VGGFVEARGASVELRKTSRKMLLRTAGSLDTITHLSDPYSRHCPACVVIQSAAKDPSSLGTMPASSPMSHFYFW
jgi:hypothetical protein